MLNILPGKKTLNKLYKHTRPQLKSTKDPTPPITLSSSTRLNIGVDARFYSMMHTGTGRYTTELINAFSLVTTHNFFLFGISPQQKPPSNLQCVYEKEPPIFDSNWEQHTLPQLLINNNIDVYISPSSLAPIQCSVPVLIVVHDLGFEHYPNFYDPKLLAYLEKWIPQCCKAAQHIITVSYFTQRDLIQTYNIPPDKISVAYPGVEHITKINEVQNINTPYIAAISSGGANKNVRGIVDTFCSLLNAHKELPHQLILLGTVP